MLEKIASKMLIYSHRCEHADYIYYEYTGHVVRISTNEIITIGIVESIEDAEALIKKYESRQS